MKARRAAKNGFFAYDSSQSVNLADEDAEATTTEYDGRNKNKTKIKSQEEASFSVRCFFVCLFFFFLPIARLVLVLAVADIRRCRRFSFFAAITVWLSAI